MKSPGSRFADRPICRGSLNGLAFGDAGVDLDQGVFQDGSVCLRFMESGFDIGLGGNIRTVNNSRNHPLAQNIQI